MMSMVSGDSAPLVNSAGDEKLRSQKNSAETLLTSAQSPLLTFRSDDLHEKLKLLKYEQRLLSELKMKPLSRFYFVKSVNPGEQFYMFTLICWWLSHQLGKDFLKPQESDDPNDITDKIFTVLNELNISVDFSPNQLIRGAGGCCLYVLDSLASHALKALQITPRGPVRVLQKENIVNVPPDETAEIILEKIDEVNQGEQISDGEDEESRVFEKDLSHKWQQYTAATSEFTPIDENIKHFADTHFWRIELEEVLPLLKIYVKRDVKDWRTHLNQLESLNKSMQENTDFTFTELKRLYHEYTFTLEKFESREKHLNSELHDLLAEYKEVATELSGLQVTHKKILEENSQSSEQLQIIIAENEGKKTEMDQRGQMMSDSSYVLKIKKAVSKLRKEVLEMNEEVAILINGMDREIIGQMRQVLDDDLDNF